MTYTAYIQRQKSLIRARHVGETFLMDGKTAIPCSTEDMLCELDKLKGLNKAERAGIFSIRREKAFA